tara:strand:- start:719 stop:916 length:198 start_codon:yes stop_codon:yes gene_type:complete
MTGASPLGASAFAEASERVEAFEQGLDALLARQQAEAIVALLRLVNDVGDVVERLRAEAMGVLAS